MASEVRINVGQAVAFVEDMQGVLLAGQVAAKEQPRLRFVQQGLAMVSAFARSRNAEGIRQAYLQARQFVNESPAYSTVGTARSPSKDVNSLADVANGIIAVVLPETKHAVVGRPARQRRSAAKQRLATS